MPKFDALLSIVKSAGATDLHLVAGSVPIIRVHGALEKTRHRKLSDSDIRQIIYQIMSDDQINRFEEQGDLDMAYGAEGIARVRMNVYQTHTGIAAAIRLISENTSDLESLGFDKTVVSLCENRSGLVLVTGPTNSGKTTTLAAMIDYINTGFSRHIITLEDPIEYVHENKNSLISQRQIGLHADSFASALRAALREDPDVVMVGEMRDTETISLAVTAAELGLLVMGTLHTCTAAATVDRIVDVFPADQQQQIRIMLADSLRGVVSQQLLRRADDGGRLVACELMINNHSISGMIREGKSHQIPNAIQTGGRQGMRLLDNHLRELVESGRIDPREAMRVATDPTQFNKFSASPKPVAVEIS